MYDLLSKHLQYVIANLIYRLRLGDRNMFKGCPFLHLYIINEDKKVLNIKEIDISAETNKS